MLPSIKTIIESFGLQPNKKLGQNFLLDQSITDTIVLAAGDIKDKNVMEIGPGPGLLTRSILQASPKKLDAIEMDTRCIKALESLQQMYPEKLNVIHADAAKFEFDKHIAGKATIVANLPYNIGSLLLLKWLKTPNKFEQIVIMLQREVVDRIVAKPSSGAYGRLSIITQMLCDVEILMEVDKSCFYPAPKVQSAVVRIVPLAKQRYDCDLQTLQKVTEAAFGMRRKMLRQSLKKIFGTKVEMLESIGISLTERAENLSVEQFCKITNLVNEIS